MTKVKKKKKYEYIFYKFPVLQPFFIFCDSAVLLTEIEHTQVGTLT